jgi:transketolase
MRLLEAEMSRRFPCYLGSALSVTDILAVLYFAILRTDPANPKDPDRDVLILSKGHASPALYAALCLRGFVSKEALLNHSTLQSPIYYHPSVKVPGVEMSTGSLGQGLSFGLGTALAQKQDGRASRTFVILGDGELDEGSNWEAILAAPAFKVTNLIAVVDRNGIQSNNRTEDLIPLGDIEAKWRSFGWRTAVMDGHNQEALLAIFSQRWEDESRPLAVIANTVRNKGISFQEGRIEAWNCQLSEDDFARACAEIRGIADLPPDHPGPNTPGFTE